MPENSYKSDDAIYIPFEDADHTVSNKDYIEDVINSFNGRKICAKELYEALGMNCPYPPDTILYEPPAEKKHDYTFPEINMTGKDIVNVYSDMNSWIDVIVVVNTSDKDRAERIVDKAIDEYWETDCVCYGDLVEEGLRNAGIIHLSIYHDSSDDSEEYEKAWDSYKASLYEARDKSNNVAEIEGKPVGFRKVEYASSHLINPTKVPNWLLRIRAGRIIKKRTCISDGPYAFDYSEILNNKEGDK